MPRQSASPRIKLEPRGRLTLRARALLRLFLGVLVAWALPAFAQSGLRLPERGEPGLDPGFARGWLAPDFDRFGFTSYHWKDTMGLAPSPRMKWSYSFGERGSLGLSLTSREFENDPRQVSLFGRYWFAQDWAVSAETSSREPTGLFRLNDFRIGVQRRF
jgi:hypothetical protein